MRARQRVLPGRRRSSSRGCAIQSNRLLKPGGLWSTYNCACPPRARLVECLGQANKQTKNLTSEQSSFPLPGRYASSAELSK